MAISRTLHKESGAVWTDLSNPSSEELRKVAKEFNLQPHAVEDCLDPSHLPKIERIGNTWFFILRVFDPQSAPHADTVQELTRKVAIFLGPQFLVSIHRTDLDFLKSTRDKYANLEPASKSESFLEVNHTEKLSPLGIQQIFFELIARGLETYNAPLDREMENLSQMENQVFLKQSSDPEVIRNAYFLKSKVFIFKRMVRMISDSWAKYATANPDAGPWLQEIRDTTDDLLFYCEDLIETIHQLMNLHLSLQSHRTNEVMRVLTVFSAIFLPLNLIAGIYGMNFEFMPELKHPYGYPIILFTMALIASTVALWIVRRGWLKS